MAHLNLFQHGRGCFPNGREFKCHRMNCTRIVQKGIERQAFREIPDIPGTGQDVVYSFQPSSMRHGSPLAKPAP